MELASLVRNFSLVALAGMALAADPHRAVFQVGVQTHFSQNKGLFPVNMGLIHQAGATSVREGVYWHVIEAAKGQLRMPAEYDDYVDRALQLGIQPLRVLGGAPAFYDEGDRPTSDEALEGYARYCELVVRHFKGRVRMYEIWNEWDLAGPRHRGPATPESYAKLLKAVYRRMKAADPAITVLGGAATGGAVRRGWLEDLLRAGALENVDAISIHTYMYGAPDAASRRPEAWAQWIPQVESMLQKYSGGKEVPLYITEMGWPTEIDRRGTPPALAAAYLARTFLLARTMPFLKGLWWYDFQNDGWDSTHNEHNFGLVRADLTPLPGYFTLSSIAELASRATYLGRIEASDPDIWILKFLRPDKTNTWAIWSAHEDDNWQVNLGTQQTAPPPLLLTEAGRPTFRREWGMRDWATANGREVRDVPLRRQQFSLIVRQTPWLVTGDLAGVTIENVQRRPFTESMRSAPSSQQTK